MSFGAGPWGNGGVGGGSTYALTPYDEAASVEQQRVTPVGYAQANLPPIFSPSTWKFVLGSDVPGRTWRAAVGDFVEVAQTADWSAEVFRFAVQTRPPKGAGDAAVWTVTVTVDGVVWDSFSFTRGDPVRTRSNVGVRGGAVGPTPHALAVRLTLTAAPTESVSSPTPHPAAPVTLTLTGATNTTPIVATSVGHGLLTGDSGLVAGVTGNTAANGYAHVTVVDADRFSLDGTTGNGAYAGGGTITAPPHAPVLTTTAILGEVELPGVYVIDVEEAAS